MLEGPSYIPEKVKHAVILCHGYGASGEDLMGLVPFLKTRLPDTAFFAPDAPENIGFGFQWFELKGFWDRGAPTAEDFKKMLELAKEPVKKLHAYIEDIKNKYELKDADIDLIGFSQGGMMVMYTALTNSEAFGHVVGMSAVPLMWTDELANAYKPKHVPFFLTHGGNDDVVPVKTVDITVAELRKAGQDPAVYISSEIGHAIDQPSLERVIDFIKR